MAVNATKFDSDLVLKVQTGIDPVTSNPVIRLRRYSRVKPEASNEGVHTVAQAIASLQIHPLVEIIRQDDWRLEVI
jgi:Protein of unknown function (DUF1659).